MQKTYEVAGKRARVITAGPSKKTLSHDRAVPDLRKLELGSVMIASVVALTALYLMHRALL